MFIKQSGWLAPFFFILLHILRQFLFVPVVLICIVGGYLFGGVYGTIYSVIGLTLTSLMFYFIVTSFPLWLNKLTKLKSRWFGKEVTLTLGQISILRLLPFMHFHLISLCIIELTTNLKEYTIRSFITNIPLAFIYTSFGHVIGELTIYSIIVMLMGLGALFYLCRRKYTLIKWKTFFSTTIEKTNEPV
ncbi:TVP38/TMEM64 family protein [Anaerobacillus sp. MEB173]|uniref:TVP38/TMEM64 family protein n=1 Tax=Anaerobacillus sp. MEB173 TaxID=3383345 RepID=UPI003F93444D